MTLDNLATVTTAGTNNVFTYATDDDYATIIEDGYFDEASNVLPNKAVIFVQGSSGLSFHFVFSQIGELPVGTADYQPPLSAANSVESQINSLFIGQVAGNNKITRSEIEATILARGLKLPSRNITIYINVFQNTSKIFLCRYIQAMDIWYMELLKKAN